MITPETKTLLGIIAPVIEAVGDGIYIWSIVRGKTRPHLFSWIAWALMLAIVFCGQVVAGAGPGAWLTGYRFVANLAIVALTLRRGDKSLTRGDLAAFGCALAGIPIWIASRNPLATIVLETAVSAALFYPTFRKTYRDPYSEQPISYSLFGVSVFVQMLAIDHYTAATLIYPIGSAIIIFCFVSMCYWRRRVLPRSEAQ